MRSKIVNYAMRVRCATLSLPLFVFVLAACENPREARPAFQEPPAGATSDATPSANPANHEIPPMPKDSSKPSESTSDPGPAQASPVTAPLPAAQAATTQIATLGAGCFWCIEAVLERIDGIVDVKSGYMGGSVAKPTYDQVCSGRTGHAEVVQVTFDPGRISYRQVLDHFWKLHDPTTLNRQGNDVGTQYRSVIFFHGEEQEREARASKAELEKKGAYSSPIVTEITKAGVFYEAEDYHQDYFRLNKAQPYCRFVIQPKLEKLGLEK